MKTEQKQLLRTFEPILICLIFAWLYSAGGSGDFGGLKWLRRFLAPSIFSLWAFLRSSFDWRYLVQMPFCFGALSLPYGSDDFIGKVILRTSFGAANGLAFSFANFFNKRIVLGIMQVILVIIASTGAGVWNQFPNAIIEQFVIGFIIIFIPAMTVRIK